MMTDQALHDYSADHLYYELWMLYETGTALVHGFGGPNASVVKNALVESFAIHARSLAAFLYDEKKWPDDVTAEDYVQDVTAWRTARGQRPSELDVTVVRTGKEIVHLTTKRHPPGSPQKAWAPQDIVRALIPPLKSFASRVPAGRLDASVITFIAGLPPERRRRLPDERRGP